MENKIYPEIEIFRTDALKLAEMCQSVHAIMKHTKSVLSKIEATAAGGANESYVQETIDCLGGVCIGLQDCTVRLINNYVGCAKNYEECFAGTLMKEARSEAINESEDSPIYKLANFIKESGRIFYREEIITSLHPRAKSRGKLREAVNNLFDPIIANYFDLTVKSLPYSSEDGKITYKDFIGTPKAFEEYTAKGFTSK